MSEQDLEKLHLSAIEYLKTQYTILGSPCYALCISHHFRCISKISKMEKNNYLDEAKFWFLEYINKRFYSKKIRLMLLDQYFFSQIVKT